MNIRNLSNCTKGCNRRVWSQGLCQSCYKRKFGAKFKTIEDAYWSRVIKSESENECWDWSAFKDEHGYGLFRFQRKQYLIHRVSFFIHYGFWTDLYVCHTCDNPSCSNPKHLFEGTQQDNMRDRDAKGRCPKGEAQGHSKLTEVEVIEIKKLLAKGEKHQDIADRFNITRPNITMISIGRSWKHVKI